MNIYVHGETGSVLRDASGWLPRGYFLRYVPKDPSELKVGDGWVVVESADGWKELVDLGDFWTNHGVTPIWEPDH